MTRKVSLRFILYFLGFYVFIALLTVSVLFVFLIKFLGVYDMYMDISELDTDYISLHVTKDESGNYSFSENFQDITIMRQGVLQILDGNNTAILSSPEEHQLPNTYHFADLIKMKNNDKFHTWTLEDGMILLFTERTNSDRIMEQLITSNDFPILTDKDMTMINAEEAIFDVFDANGDNFFTTNEQKTLTYEDIFHTPFDWKDIKEFKTYHMLDDNSIAVVRTENEYYESMDSIFKNVSISVLKGIGVFHVILLVIVITFSLLISRRFARPILYFLRRIERLAKNDYSDYQDKKLKSMKTGKLKAKYKIYEDIDYSLTVLTNNLISNDEKIKHTEKLREDWITGLSHDLKTPLSTVLGYAAMLGSAHEWSEDEIKNFSKIIEEKATYMDELIEDLTYTYQLKNKGVQLDKAEVNLNEYIWNYLHNNTFDNIKLEASDVHVDVLLDEKRFTRVLENIISNAIKHNQADTSIIVRIKTERDKAILEIIDDGVGMSDEMLENLFNRYYRGTNTTSDNIGTGLGLTIARQLVEAHGGDINVSSSSDGTTVRISLPLG